MRKLRLQFLVVLGLAVAACGGEATEVDPVDSVSQASKEDAKECELKCPAVIDPVCGSDGKIHNNACEAECAGAKVVDDACCTTANPPSSCDGVGEVVGSTAQGLEKEEPKTCEEICPAVVDPVCGTDGKTYDNACLANCYGEKVVDDACCTSANPPSMCDGEGDVVGLNSDGGSVTPGDDSCNCPAVVDPVCGVDGKTYGNSCHAACEKVDVDYAGECKE